MFLYNLIDKYLMRDFTELIIKNLKTKKPKVIVKDKTDIKSKTINMQEDQLE